MDTIEADSLVIIDVGSTTTKAVLLAPRSPGGSCRLAARAEAATTVEKPHEDVMIGVRRACAELARRAGVTVLDPRSGLPDRSRVRLYLATSSAGGGLQIMVCGVMRKLTAASAEQAALGAGAVVLDVLAADDDRTPLQRFRAISSARPDMFLVAGGLKDGVPGFILQSCDFLNLAEMSPRFGAGYRVPIVFAGTEAVRQQVAEVLGRRYDVLVTPNLRPDSTEENLEPVRQAIVELFESHVMARAPGYEGLLRYVDAPPLPTPAAAGRMLIHLSQQRQGEDILCLDLGGATTDVFSVRAGELKRSVSANLGVSYSATNVLAQAGPARIASWLPFPISEDDLRDQIASKALNPTTVPETAEELLIEQALATEAMRLAMEQHRSFCLGEPAKASSRRRPSLVIGSGGLLASAPRRAQAALILLNAVRPGGVFRLYLDSVFMLPHLGALSQVEPQTALEVLFADCLLPLGTVAQAIGEPHAPRGSGPAGPGLSRRKARPRPSVLARLTSAGDETRRLEVRGGEIGLLPLERGSRGRLDLSPEAGLNFGAGPGKTLGIEVEGGEVGVIVDNRQTPQWPGDWPDELRTAQVRRWFEALGALPPSALEAPEGQASRQ